MSFISQLYEPKYVHAPGGRAAGGSRGSVRWCTRAVRDQWKCAAENRRGWRGSPAPAAPSAAFDGGSRGAADGDGGCIPGRADGEGTAPRRQALPVSIAADATARELGELFEYRISQAGDGPEERIRHAAVPAAEDRIARKLLIYSDDSSAHPTNAAELTNSTGKTLDGGPITVYDGGAYAGEALMETLKAGDKRLISYAVDLGTRITDGTSTARPPWSASSTPTAAC